MMDRNNIERDSFNMADVNLDVRVKFTETGWQISTRVPEKPGYVVSPAAVAHNEAEAADYKPMAVFAAACLGLALSLRQDGRRA